LISRDHEFTSDAGLLVVRELDERLGLSELISDNLTDARHGQEYATASAGSVAPVDLQPPGLDMKISMTPSAFLKDPTFPPDWLGEDTGIAERALPSRLHWF